MKSLPTDGRQAIRKAHMGFQLRRDFHKTTNVANIGVGVMKLTILVDPSLVTIIIYPYSVYLINAKE